MICDIHKHCRPIYQKQVDHNAHLTRLECWIWYNLMIYMLHVESSDRWFVNSLFCRVLSLASCASTRHSFAKKFASASLLGGMYAPIKHFFWRVDRSGCLLWKNAPPPPKWLKSKNTLKNRYSKHPWSTVWTWCQSQSCPEFCRSFLWLLPDPRKIVYKKSLRNGDVNMIALTRPQSTVCARLEGTDARYLESYYIIHLDPKNLK